MQFYGAQVLLQYDRAVLSLTGCEPDEYVWLPFPDWPWLADGLGINADIGDGEACAVFMGQPPGPVAPLVAGTFVVPAEADVQEKVVYGEPDYAPVAPPTRSRWIWMA